MENLPTHEASVTQKEKANYGFRITAWFAAHFLITSL